MSGAAAGDGVRVRHGAVVILSAAKDLVCLTRSTAGGGGPAPSTRPRVSQPRSFATLRTTRGVAGTIPSLMRRFVSALLPAAALAAPLAAQPPAPPDVRDLPLVEVPGAVAPAAPSALAQRSLAILITGDGDWAAIDKGIAGAVAAGGVPVVGLKVRAYLEHGKRTPDGLTRDVERLARAYMARWNRDRVLLLGFSRGAEYAPFIMNRIAPDLRDHIALVGMYGPEENASFEYHFLDLFTNQHRASDVPVAPELARMVALPGLRAFCVYGADENDSACKNAPDAPALRKIERGGAHHFDKNYPGLGRLALEELGR
ncbi:hypothetical protein tb265_18420 [Gemmatimonadetes bacterium T265]|nr:hypothetical protein tb265_18420 [Gemmatimonadetes bacterium T265]